MARRRSRAAAAGRGAALVLLSAAGLLLLPGVPSRAAAAPTFTYTAGLPHATITTAGGKPVTVAAGGTVTILNNSPETLTISGQLVASPPRGEATTIAAQATGAFVVPAPTGTSRTVTFTADEPPNIAGITSATGSMTVAAAPVSTSAGGAASSASGPVAGDGTPAGAPSGFVGPGLPGGVIAPVAPGADALPSGPPPLVAPFASVGTSGARASATAHPPATGEPPALRAASAGPGRRALGLPAAIAAVLIVGVVAALVRVLLADPAARLVGQHR